MVNIIPVDALETNGDWESAGRGLFYSTGLTPLEVKI